MIMPEPAVATAWTEGEVAVLRFERLGYIKPALLNLKETKILADDRSAIQ